MDQRIDRRGLVWQLAGNTLTATCYGSPGDGVFAAMRDWVAGSGVRVQGVIFEDRRGPIGSLSLKRVRRLGRDLGVPVVLLADSPLVRLVVLISRRLGHDIHTCRRGNVDQALLRLAVPESQQATVKAAVHALRVARALGGSRRRRSSDASSQTPASVG